MTSLTAEHLHAILPGAPAGDIEEEFPSILRVMREYQINTKLRFAAFIANVAKESGQLHFLEEIWGPTDAQLGYEGREDLGNTQEGDGPFFKGHGYIQITGRNNHGVVGQALGVDAISDPEILTRMPYAWLSAGYYWRNMSSLGNLNDIADRGDFESTVLGVRGGEDPDRRSYYDKAMEVLPDDLDISEQGDDVAEPEFKALELVVTSQGWVYEPISQSFCKIGGGPDATYKPDANGWMFREGSVAAQPVPDFDWPEANEPAIEDSFDFVERHPIRYTWRSDVDALIRRVLANFGVDNLSANTYVDHPEGFGRTTTSVDFWAPEGRGEPIGREMGQAVFDFIFNDPNPPMIEWCIWRGQIWVFGVGFFDFPDDGTGLHFDHPHFTFF